VKEKIKEKQDAYSGIEGGGSDGKKERKENKRG